MILIISRQFELTVIDVANWLYSYGKKFLIFDSESNAEISIKINQDSESIFLNKKPLDDFHAVWYRNGVLNNNSNINNKNNYLNTRIDNFLDKEWKVITNHFFKALQNKKSLGDYFSGEFNKLDQLILAKKCGLIIPQTILGTNIDEFSELKNHKKITKPVCDIFIAADKEFVYSSYVKEISERNIQRRNGSFFPSLIQEKIERKYEIRIFFIHEKLYAMAVFNKDNRIVDIRDSNSEEKRFVPYNLNNDIKQKLLDFIALSGLTTGSIDMIVTPSNDFCFLEVNPFGEFDYLSKYCNYYIDKEIADYFNS